MSPGEATYRGHNRLAATTYKPFPVNGFAEGHEQYRSAAVRSTCRVRNTSTLVALTN